MMSDGQMDRHNQNSQPPENKKVQGKYIKVVQPGLYIVTCQTRTALVKFGLRNLIVYFLLGQLAHLGVLNTVS